MYINTFKSHLEKKVKCLSVSPPPMSYYVMAPNRKNFSEENISFPYS